MHLAESNLQLDSALQLIKQKELSDEHALDLLRACIESSISQFADQLLVAADFGRETVAEIEFSSVLAAVVDKAKTLIDGELASVCLLDSRQEHLHQQIPGFKHDSDARLCHSLHDLPDQEVLYGTKATVRESTCATCLFQSHVTQCVIVPLRVSGQTIGALCVMSKRGSAPLPTGKLPALDLYAEWAAIAIANAEKVRTARDRARAERERMVAHLHDNAAQSLGVLVHELERAEETLSNQDVESTAAHLRSSRTIAQKVFLQVRSVLGDLNEPAPPAEDLVTGLAACVEAFRETARLPVEFEVVGKRHLPLMVQGQATHIVREALINIRRHANAQSVRLQVVHTEHELKITIQDDGKGFDDSMIGQDHHLGVVIMRERAKRSGGHLSIDSGHGCGTQITLCYPVSALEVVDDGIST